MSSYQQRRTKGRRTEEGKIATNYFTSGALLRQQGALRDDADQIKCSVKWIPDRCVLPQVCMEKIVQSGSLPLLVCCKLVQEARSAVETSGTNLFGDDCTVELFPRRLSLAVSKEGRVVSMAEAGLRNLKTPAVIDISAQQAATYFGRDRSIADVPLDHPSCSSQHAVVANLLHFDGCGEVAGCADWSDVFDIDVAIMDLKSTHGTTVNGERLSPMLWRRLKVGDTIVFGLSSRQYVVVASPPVTPR